MLNVEPLHLLVILTNRSQGSLPRINTISVELLSLILHFSRAEPRLHFGTSDLHYQNLSIVRLSAVCRIWRAVAIGDAILWCNIAFSTSRLSTIKCATEFLRRSREAIITVQLFDFRRDTTSHIDEVSELAHRIAQQSGRIGKFEAVGLSFPVVRALALPAVRLTHLTINGRGVEELPLVFGGQLPHLKQLTLSNPSGWQLRAFQDVTRVELFGAGSRILLSSLIDFLDGATNLEQLVLSRFSEFRPERRNVEWTPVTLPSLRELRFSDCNAARILDHLDLPPSARVSILATYDPNNRHVLHYLPSMGSFHRFLDNTRSLSITLHSTGDVFHLVARPCNSEFACLLRIDDDRKRFDEGWVLRSIDAIAECKPFSRINTLNVSVGQCAVPWRRWLPRLDQLVSADVCSIDIGDLVFTLSRTHPRCGGPICPSLRRLSVERRGCGPALDSSVLKMCLLARSQAGHPISRLRLQAWDWTLIDRMDLGWKALIRSRGKYMYISDDPPICNAFIPQKPQMEPR